MSRSRPHESSDRNPATRWFEWNGEKGCIRYYDKDAKLTHDLPMPFTFVLLDQLGSVRGWHDASKSGIYSNEVKDSRQESLLVKSFKGGVLAEGIYRDIKDRVASQGGAYTATLYCAYRDDDGLALGAVRFKGAALGAWAEFAKANRGAIYEQAIAVTGYTEGKHGRVTYRVPTFKVVPLSAESNAAAKALDETLQQYLDAYLKRPTTQRVDEAQGPSEPPDDPPYQPPVTDDDIPFN